MLMRYSIAGLLLVAAPASAGQRATYAQPDGKLLVIDVADNGETRVGEPGTEEYGLLRPDGFYMVSREDGEWRTARIADIASAIDQVLPPIFKDVFTAAVAKKTPSAFRIEATGEEREVAGRTGKVYRVSGMNAEKPAEADLFVISDDPALKPVGRAMEQFMNSAMVPAAVFVGAGAADLIAETRAIFALGTPLDSGGRFKLEKVETANIPAAAMKLPSKPQSVPELVAAMKSAQAAMPR